MAGSLLLSAAGPLLFSELSLELGPGNLTRSKSYAHVGATGQAGICLDRTQLVIFRQ